MKKLLKKIPYLVDLWSSLKTLRYLLFAQPQLQIYQKNYDHYWKNRRGIDGLGHLNLFQRRRAELVEKYLTLNGKVLDIGCGDGAVLQFLRSRKAIQGIGADISSFALTAVQEAGFESLRLDLQQPESVASIPVVDHILLLEVIEHLPDPEKLIAALQCKARKNLVVSFPNTGYIGHRMRLLMGRFPLQWRVHPGEHLRYWTLQDAWWWAGEIERELGLHVQTIETYEGMSFLNRLWPGMFAMGIVVVIAGSEGASQ